MLDHEIHKERLQLGRAWPGRRCRNHRSFGTTSCGRNRWAQRGRKGRGLGRLLVAGRGGPRRLLLRGLGRRRPAPLFSAADGRVEMEHLARLIGDLVGPCAGSNRKLCGRKTFICQSAGTFQHCPHEVKRFDPRPLRDVAGNHGDVLALENRAVQIRQDLLRADLDQDRFILGDDAADQVDVADGRDQLGDEVRADVVGLGHVAIGDAAEDRHPRRQEAFRVYGAAQRPGGGLHDRAMVRPGNGEQVYLVRLRLEHGRQFCEGFTAAGNDGLVGGVVVRHVDVAADPRSGSLNDFQGRGGGQHAARDGGLGLDRVAAGPRHP